MSGNRAAEAGPTDPATRRHLAAFEAQPTLTRALLLRRIVEAGLAGAAEDRPERNAGQFELRGPSMRHVTPQELEYLCHHIREAIAAERLARLKAKSIPIPSPPSRNGAGPPRPPRRMGAP